MMQPTHTLSLALFTIALGLTQNVYAKDSAYTNKSSDLKHGRCILGAGAALTFKKSQAWARQYKKVQRDKCIDVSATGSKAALKFLSAGSSDFAIIDFPLSDIDQKTGKSFRTFHIGIDAVAPIYNLGDISGLRLSKQTLLAIFTGEVTQWNDNVIRKDNPGLNLPSAKILLHHDLPSAQLWGTSNTKVFLQFLKHAAKSANKELPLNHWPVESNKYKGAEGAPGFVKNNYGSLSYAWVQPTSNGFKYAAVENNFGEFIKPTSESISKASQKYGVSNDFYQRLTFEPVRGAYPIAAPITIVYDVNGNKKLEIETFIKWVLVDGQKIAAKIGEPSLSSELSKQQLNELHHDRGKGRMP